MGDRSLVALTPRRLAARRGYLPRSARHAIQAPGKNAARRLGFCGPSQSLRASSRCMPGITRDRVSRGRDRPGLYPDPRRSQGGLSSGPKTSRLDRTVKSQETAQAPEAPATLGQRLRQARVACGLTQSELADSRFSKQYVSQLERDQLRPTGETLAWLAERLELDPSYLATGIDGRQRDRVESALARAEAAVEAHDYAEA